jgi:hypothetical protein
MKNIFNFNFFVSENYDLIIKESREQPYKTVYKYAEKNPPGAPDGAFSFVLNLLRKCFYESHDKRTELMDESRIKLVSPDTIEYLGFLYDFIDFEIGCYNTSFIDKYGRLPQTVYDRAICISGGHFGGFGRTTRIDEKIECLPFPPNKVTLDLMYYLLDPQRRKEMIEIGKKTGIIP